MSHTIAKNVRPYKDSDGKWYLKFHGAESNERERVFEKWQYPKKGNGFSSKREADSFALSQYQSGMIQGGRCLYASFMRAIERGTFHSPVLDRAHRIMKASDKAWYLSSKLWDGVTLADGHFCAEPITWKRHQALYESHYRFIYTNLADDFYKFCETLHQGK